MNVRRCGHGTQAKEESFFGRQSVAGDGARASGKPQGIAVGGGEEGQARAAQDHAGEVAIRRMRFTRFGFSTSELELFGRDVLYTATKVC
jgi:hypothetical protein